jgi:hypothetical protein
VHHNAYHQDPYAQEFGIRIDERLASVEARVLPPPWVRSKFKTWLTFVNISCLLYVMPQYLTNILCSLSTTIVAERRMSCQELANGI